jgi:GNAT superfamily N-acetyltransferase
LSATTRSEAGEASALEAVLHDALRVFGRLPGGREGTEADHAWVLGGRPFGSANHIFSIRFREPAATAAADLLERLQGTGAAVTWWLTPSTRPVGLDRVLAARGLREEELEVGMVLDRGSFTPPPPRPAFSVETVDASTAADWVAVMAASYGWPDMGRAGMVRDAYGFAGGPPAVNAVHLLARDGDRPVACSSLFILPSGAWVTNVGTIPAARGRGAGSAVTVAAIEAALGAGHARIWLAASLLGAPVYRRLGFRSVCSLGRFTSGSASA